MVEVYDVEVVLVVIDDVENVRDADVVTRDADVVTRDADVVTRAADVVTRAADVVTRAAADSAGGDVEATSGMMTNPASMKSETPAESR
jgi:hypothetical protein